MTTDTKTPMVPTRVSGAGQVISELYEGVDRCEKPFVDFLVLTRDLVDVRILLWDTSEDQFIQAFGAPELKGRRVEFSGLLRAPYDGDGNPTVESALTDLTVGGYE
jgi:hypothetical protein